jgi:hypothetical protein
VSKLIYPLIGYITVYKFCNVCNTYLVRFILVDFDLVRFETVTIFVTG